GVIEIRRLIQRLAALGKTIFLSSHVLYEVQQVCNRVAILQKGNLVKQGSVSELLRHTEQVEIRFNREDETQYAAHLLQQMQGQDLSWISNIRVEQRNQQGLPTLILDAPTHRSAEINAFLASHNLFAAELHPRLGSLEELFLEVTTPSSPDALHPGMDELAGAQPPSQQPATISAPLMPEDGKRDTL
ncbi:MAG: hypothetical protein JO202_04755, partial [Ktedonobacteraceae bacterium]|nr:hypothetical protein [Ktedonobacteraceae bacterium]